ncbi:MAG TPA: phenylalanine--tRNA ligase subunit beta, partial [Candidatus Tumulicola sp.]
TTNTMVIADGSHALGIAGIMGGRDSEVTPATTAIVLEAATFEGARVRRAAKALGLRTEAAARHEKTLPPKLADFGASRAAWLLVRMGAEASAVRAFGDPVDTPAPIELRPSYVTRLLGFEVPAQRIATELESLGCSVTIESDVLHVTAPWWRRDILIAADLVEEVARMEGYDRIDAAVPSVAPHQISTESFDRERHLAHALASLDYREVVSYSLRPADEFERVRRTGIAFDGDPVEVRNPLSEDQRYLRTSLIAGFVAYCAQVDQTVRTFEIGDTFRSRAGTIEESRDAIFGFAAEANDEPAWRDSNFLQLKGDCETLLEQLSGRTFETQRAEAAGLHPGKTAAITIDGSRVAILGAVDPRLAVAFDARLQLYAAFIDVDAIPAYAVKRYRAPSKFPGTTRDLALTLDASIDAARVERAIVDAIGEDCTSAKVFDEYRGPQIPAGKKSLAVRFELQLRDATITDAQADSATERARSALESQLGATLRA